MPEDDQVKYSHPWHATLIPGHVLYISSVHMYRQKLHVLSLLIVGHSQPTPLACFLSYDWEVKDSIQKLYRVELVSNPNV